MQRIPTFVLTLLLSGAAQASDLIGEARVVFQDQHDPNLIALADGRQLSVLYDDGAWEAVDALAPGAELALGFDAEHGTVLVLPNGGPQIPVVDDLGDQHPIARAAESCMQLRDSTLGMHECLGEAMERWDLQLNLHYKRLTAGLSEESLTEVKAAQRAWMAWRDAQYEAFTALSSDGGSLGGVINGQRRLAIVREQAVRLGGLAAD
ncbi:MAG: DUF1311 domain-containing protein [Xanthomonadales bacterium]|nr:DUF1311 domain-containing protein [Xanthomonadales bacterium]